MLALVLSLIPNNRFSRSLGKYQKPILPWAHDIISYNSDKHAPFKWEGNIIFDGERHGDMICDVLKTCLKCIVVAVKYLDGKILHYVKNRFLSLIYIKSARDREMKIIPLNRACKIWSIFFTS